MPKVVTKSTIYKTGSATKRFGLHRLSLTPRGNNVVFNCPAINQIGGSANYDVIVDILTAINAVAKRGTSVKLPNEILTRTRRGVQFLEITIED